MSADAMGTSTFVTSCCSMGDRKSTRLNSSHANISYAVFCLKKKRYYRYVFDLLNTPPHRLPLQDINHLQSPILFNIGEHEVTVAEMTTRGSVLGSYLSSIIE